jgi:hypothetical protein
MRFFTGQKTISAISRQTYSGGKSSFSSVGTGTGYLRPLNEQESSFASVQFGLAFSLIVETGVDIQETDKVTIDSITYVVRGVVNHDRGGLLAYRKALIIKDTQ